MIQRVLFVALIALLTSACVPAIQSLEDVPLASSLPDASDTSDGLSPGTLGGPCIEYKCPSPLVCQYNPNCKESTSGCLTYSCTDPNPIDIIKDSSVTRDSVSPDGGEQ